jgi:hypothetical protein
MDEYTTDTIYNFKLTTSKENLRKFVEGGLFTFKTGGKEYTRRVYWSNKQGLHINFRGYAVAYEDFN